MPTSRRAVVITSPVPNVLVRSQDLSVGADNSYMPKSFLCLQQIQAGIVPTYAAAHQPRFPANMYICSYGFVSATDWLAQPDANSLGPISPSSVPWSW